MRKVKWITEGISLELLTSLFLLFYGFNVFPQGSWNIEYISIDSLNHQLIGEEIRLDFKSHPNDTLKGGDPFWAIRYLLANEDTISLTLDGELIKFKETWNIFPDHGVLEEQALEKVQSDEEEKIIIKEILLKAIDENRLVVKIFIYTSTETEKKIININKSDLRGVLFRI